MNWQQPAALTVVAATAVMMVVARWARRRRPGRGGPCGCPGPPAGMGPRIIFHARKGERPVVIYKPR